MEVDFIGWPFMESVFSPRGLRPHAHLVPKDKRAFHTGDYDIGGTVAVQIGHDELRADAGTIVNQFRNEFSAAFGLRIANRAVPVKDSRAIGVGVEVALQM